MRFIVILALLPIITVVAPSLKFALDGSVQTCFRWIVIESVMYPPGCGWPSELGISISVERVRVRRVEREARADDLSFTAGSRNHGALGNDGGDFLRNLHRRPRDPDAFIGQVDRIARKKLTTRGF